MIGKAAVTLLIVLALGTADAFAFSPNKRGESNKLYPLWRMDRRLQQTRAEQASEGTAPWKTSTQLITRRRSSTQLFEKKRGGMSIDGKDRGNYIMAVVLFLNVWLFSVPPEFRRAYICPPQDYCIEQRSRCSNCVTFQEWTDGIADYYKGGGGIQFDFSIDPATLARNKQIMDDIFSSKK